MVPSVTFSGAVQSLINGLERVLYEPGVMTDLLGKVEQKSGVPRLYIVAGLLLLHVLYLLHGSWARLLCNFTGVLYPIYASVYAIESPTKEDDTQWLTYWVVFALLSVAEFSASTIIRFIPFYWLMKFVFLLYLHLPMTLGAQKLYSDVVCPIY